MNILNAHLLNVYFILMQLFVIIITDLFVKLYINIIKCYYAKQSSQCVLQFFALISFYKYSD